MTLKQLTIHNFKNISETQLDFSPKVNCFLGNNGMGKSNLLDAIYFLSFCKSFSGVQDSLLIKQGEDFCMARGLYQRRGIEEDISIGMANGKRKSLKRKGKEYDRLSSHIGLFPLVLISPQDSDLIKGGSEERRRLMDMVISQSDRTYLDHLIRYNKALEIRNKMLRDGVVDHSLYLAIEMSMDFAAQYIHQARSKWVEQLTDIFARYYRVIAGSDETICLSYRSSLNTEGISLQQLLDDARRHDEIVKYTSVGIHRDDIDMSLNNMPVRKTASQGQCKTYTIALRLAQYDFLCKSSNMHPILLLDDIFDKLDASRVERIMTVVEDDQFGQIFITDTNRTHLDEIMQRTGGHYSMWEVANGTFTPIQHPQQ